MNFRYLFRKIFHKDGNDYIILIHGLRKTFESMRPIAKILANHNYNIISFFYPYRQDKLEDLVEKLHQKIIQTCTKKHKRIHFVTHSFGGIIIRCLLKENPSFNIGRIVMLAPPNHGSELVNYIKKFALFKLWYGVNLKELSTGDDTVLRRLGPVNQKYEVGIIAGDKTSNKFISLFIPGRDDGRVAVERAKLKGMKDFLVVHNSHSDLIEDEFVKKQVIHFIKYGRFNKKL